MSKKGYYPWFMASTIDVQLTVFRYWRSTSGSIRKSWCLDDIKSDPAYVKDMLKDIREYQKTFNSRY